jgi:WD40 repeat protein
MFREDFSGCTLGGFIALGLFLAAPEGPLPQQLRGHTDWIASLAFSPDGKTLVSAGNDQTIRLWGMSSHKEKAVLRRGTGSVRKIVFTPDGKNLLSDDNDESVDIWDITTLRKRASLKCGSVGALPLAVSPGSSVFTANGKGYSVVGRDIKTGKVVVTFRGHSESVSRAVFSRDGTMLVTASGDTTVRVWDAASARLRTVLWDGILVNDVAVSPDGRLVASAGNDKVLRVWNLARIFHRF